MDISFAHRKLGNTSYSQNLFSTSITTQYRKQYSFSAYMSVNLADTFYKHSGSFDHILLRQKSLIFDHVRSARDGSCLLQLSIAFFPGSCLFARYAPR